MRKDYTVMDYVNITFDERDKVANGYSRGINKTKATNLNKRSEIYSFLSERGITSPGDLQAFIDNRTTWLINQDEKIENIKSEYERIEKRLILGRTYKKYKAVYGEYQGMYFGKKKFYAAHEKEIRAFKQAERKLKETMPDLDGVESAIKGDEHYLEERNEKIAEIKAGFAPVKEELKKLKEIRTHMNKAFEILGIEKQVDTAEGQSQSILSNQSDAKKTNNLRDKLKKNKDLVDAEKSKESIQRRKRSEQEL